MFNPGANLRNNYYGQHFYRGRILDDNPAKLFAAGFVVLIAAVFVALAFWTKKKPYTAILTALIIMLVLGLRNAKESQHLMEAYGKKK